MKMTQHHAFMPPLLWVREHLVVRVDVFASSPVLPGVYAETPQIDVGVLYLWFIYV